MIGILDFEKLFNSGMIDFALIKQPLEGNENESAAKYLSLAGADTININTAPRNVLEATFTFSGYPTEIAAEIIERRRIKPFESIEELKELLYRYSNDIEKMENLIETQSSFFTITVTASKGKAKTTAMVAVQKQNNDVTRIGIIYD